MTIPTPRGDESDIPPQIEDKARHWLARMTSGSASDAEREAQEHWLNQDERHRRAYEETEALWRQLGQLASRPLPRLSAEAKPGHVAVPASPTPRTLAVRRQRRRPLMATAACAALIAAAAGIHLMPYWFADYTTQSGEFRAITLDDGSLIHLNTASAINVDYAPERRDVRLLKGEAEFVVRKNPARPFVVTAGDERIRALGTDFIVRFDKEAVTVTQLENRVEITTTDSGPVSKTVLNPGQQLHRTIGEPLSHPITVDTAMAAAWRRGKLIFESAPLSEVIAEINRYRPGAAFLLGSEHANLTVSGVFDLQRLDRLLAVIEQTLPIKATHLGSHVVLLY
jgi:transmembrane sensor